MQNLCDGGCIKHNSDFSCMCDAGHTVNPSDILLSPCYKAQYFEKIQELPLIHNNPFDRLIIATALEEELSLITHDTKIGQYDAKVFW